MATPLTRTRRILEVTGVESVLDAAQRDAVAKGYRVVIAVTDATGRLLGLRRTPDAQPASDQVAIDKARTAAIFVRPSREIEQQVTDGRRGRRCDRDQRRDHRRRRVGLTGRRRRSLHHR